jgi:Ser/Thr protein kinase RdoA (MazF antagonist)
MSVTKAHVAQRILAALGLDAHLTIDVAEDKDVASSTLSTHGIKRFVVSHYEELTGSAQCQLVQRGVNDTYLISSSDRRYSLKVYRLHWLAPEQIIEELHCIGHLAKQGVLIAAAIARRDRSLITQIPTPEGTRYAVLHSWIPGALPSFNDETQSTLVGRYLAQLHAAGDQLRMSPSRSRLEMADIFDRPLTHIRSQIENQPSQVARLDAVVERLTHSVRQASAELQDWGFCHGDAANVNLRIDRDRVYFFDFEVCGPGWRLYDLATYIWSAYYVGRVRTFRWEPIVESYFLERPKFAASAKFLPLFVVLRYFWHAAQIIRLTPYVGVNAVSNRFFDDLLTFCERLDQDLIK